MPKYPCGNCSLCLTGDYIHCESDEAPELICGSETGTATYAQYCIKPHWLCLPVPDDVSLEHASMACCGLGPAFGAMERMAVDALDTLLVIGLGPVGLGAVVNGVVRGARVLGVDRNPYRVALAKELGAQDVLDPNDGNILQKVYELTRGRGADKVVETAGVVAAQRLMIDALRRRGEGALVGECDEPLETEASRDMIRKGIVIHGIWHWRMTDTPRMWATIRQGRDLLSKLITHEFPMGSVQEAWELQMRRECGKVLLRPWG